MISYLSILKTSSGLQFRQIQFLPFYAFSKLAIWVPILVADGPYFTKYRVPTYKLADP